MKRTEDLAKEIELLKTELERREIEETLRRKIEKEMEEPELGKSKSIVSDAEFVNRNKRDPEIEEGLREKQKEAQKEPNPVQTVLWIYGYTEFVSCQNPFRPERTNRKTPH